MDPQEKACLAKASFHWDRFEIIEKPRYGGLYEIGADVTISAAAHQDRRSWDKQTRRCNSVVGPAPISFAAVLHPAGKEDGVTIAVTGQTTRHVPSADTTFKISLVRAGTYVVTAESSVRRSVTLKTVHPYDIVWDTTDVNGFPLNPRWGSQTHAQQPSDLTTLGPRIADCIGGKPICENGYTDEGLVCQRWGADPDTKKKASLPNPFERFNCTTQPTYIDQPPGDQTSFCTSHWGFSSGKLVAIAPLFGHLTWLDRIITVEAPMKWDGAAPECDRDYSFNVFPARGELTTEGNTNLHCEFDSQETIGYGSTPSWPGFWKELHDDIEQSWKATTGSLEHDCGAENFDQSSVHGYLDGRTAIVIGIAGLDTAHATWPTPAAGVEIHPVLGLGVHLGDTVVSRIRAPIATLPPNTVIDRWAFFARNWGDGGAGPTPCSGTIYEVNAVRKLRFRIPWSSSASDVAIAAQHFIGQGRGSIEVHKGSDIVVSLELPPAAARQNEVGELWLSWTFPRGRPAPLVVDLDALAKRAWRDEAAAAIGRRYSSMSKSQQSHWLAGLRSIAPVSGPPQRTRPLAGQGARFVRAVPNERAAADAERAKRSLCQMFNGKPPKDFEPLGPCPR